MSKICEWFHHNGFRANPWKFNVFTKSIRRKINKILWSNIAASKEEVLLGVEIDSDIPFKEHVTSICSKANQKFHEVTMVSKYTSLQNRRIIMKSFITSQVNYFPIV